MPLTVGTFATYLTSPSLREENKGHWDSFKFVQAIKGTPFSGYATVPVAGTKRRLTQANADRAIEWFGIMAADLFEDDDPQQVLVPVPNSGSLIGGPPPRTLELARAVMTASGGKVRVEDLLRWRTSPGSARRGTGSRNPENLYPLLEVFRSQWPDAEFILIDDVMTTGGHLRACAAALRAANLRCEVALCAARTVQSATCGAFDVLTTELPPFEPATETFLFKR